MKKIFVICTVRGATPEYIEKLEKYVAQLEDNGHTVHLPHRDTNQNARGFDICIENMVGIIWADEVHIFYNSKSQGTHFDMGVAFALHKPIVVVENEPLTEGKSYQRMLVEWEDEYKPKPTNLYEFTMTDIYGVVTKSTIPCDSWIQADRVNGEILKSKKIQQSHFNQVQ